MLLFPAATAQDNPWAGCKIDDEGVDCRQQQAAGGGGDDSFWTSNAAQTLYWVLGALGSGGAAIFGWTRVKRRRRELRTFINDVEKTFAQAKEQPDVGLPKLEALRRGLAASHNAGKLEDPQFLEMDRRLKDYVTRVRVIQLERAFPSMPVALFTDIGSLLADGTLSQSDLVLIDKRALQLGVPSAPRQDLAAFLRRDTPLVARKRQRLAVIAR